MSVKDKMEEAVLGRESLRPHCRSDFCKKRGEGAGLDEEAPDLTKPVPTQWGVLGHGLTNSHSLH